MPLGQRLTAITASTENALLGDQVSAINVPCNMRRLQLSLHSSWQKCLFTSLSRTQDKIEIPKNVQPVISGAQFVSWAHYHCSPGDAGPSTREGTLIEPGALICVSVAVSEMLLW